MSGFFGTRGWWFALACAFLIMGAHLANGANTNALAMLFAVLTFGIVALGLFFVPQTGWVLVYPPLWWVAGLFFLTLLYVALQLTSFLPGGVHPFWDWVSKPGGVSIDKDATLLELIKLTALGAIFVAGLILGADDRRALVFVKVLLLFGLFYALWAFIINIDETNIATYGYTRRFIRLQASFQSANTTATVMGIQVILALGYLFRSIKKIMHKTNSSVQFLEQLIVQSSIGLSALLLSLSALFLTASRGGISSSLIAILVLAAWELVASKRRRDNSNRFAVSMVLLFMALGILSFMFSGEMIIKRLSGTHLIDVNRDTAFAIHWQAFKAVPWTGYGMGSFYQVNDLLMNVQNWYALHNLGALHNVYLQWLEEAGIIGTVLMFSTITLVLWHIFKGLGVRQRMHTWIRTILCVSLFILLHGMMDYGLQVPSIAMTWALLLGIGFSLAMKRPD